MGLEHITIPEWELELQLSRIESTKTCFPWGLFSVVVFPLSCAKVFDIFPWCYFCLYQVWVYGHISGMYSVCERPVWTGFSWEGLCKSLHILNSPCRCPSSRN